jgi:hypothetical protein
VPGKSISPPHLSVISKEDSLMSEIRSSIYNNIYNPKFWGEYTTPTFTILKVTYDNNGDVKHISFSDSADSSFLKLYSKMPTYHDIKTTFKNYAAIKSYRDISLLIPVYYEPSYTSHQNQNFYYFQIESIMKFNGKEFVGKSILLRPIVIRVLKEHNM